MNVAFETVFFVEIFSCWLTCRKWEEGLSFPEFTVLVQKMLGVEGMWSLPHGFIMQNRVQCGHDYGSLRKYR